MHPIQFVYGPSCDFPKNESKPRLEYMFAAVPRSGSTFFSHELWKTGGLGAPLEYPNIKVVKNIIARLSKNGDIQEYWHALKQIRTSPNGVFGYKMFMQNMRDIARDCPDLLKQVQPEKVVYLRRRDLLGQTVSYAKAMQTGAWFSGVEYKKDPEFDVEKLKQAEHMLTSQYEFWENYFSATGADVLRLYYEDIVEDLAAAISQVAHHLEVDLSNCTRVDVDSPTMQRDELSHEWAKKYSELAVNE